MYIVYANVLKDGTLNYLELAGQIVRGQDLNQRLGTCVKHKCPGSQALNREKLDLCITPKQLCRICGRGRPRLDRVSIWRLSSFLEAYLGYPKSAVMPPKPAVPVNTPTDAQRDPQDQIETAAYQLPKEGFAWEKVAGDIHNLLLGGKLVRVIGQDESLGIMLGQEFVDQVQCGVGVNSIMAQYRIAGFLSYVFYSGSKQVPGLPNV